MKVGDLVKFESVLNDSMDRYSTEYGLVMQLSKTGHDTISAQVWFGDTQKQCWLDSSSLVVVSEAGK